MSEEERKSKSGPGSRAKLAAFSLMLAVPAALSGCGTGTNDDCDPEYDNSCDRSSSHSSYRGGSSFYNSNKDKSSYSSSGSSSSKSSGFGSFFSGSGG
ncbi:hypothetical protein D3C74_67550 [compost metagenome]